MSQEADWDGERILKRGNKLLKFIETRWNIRFIDEEQMIDLLHISFVNDGRADVHELPEPEVDESFDPGTATTKVLAEWHLLRMDFWENFVHYCHTLISLK